MQPPSVALKTLRDLRWQVFWYGLGLALMSAFVIYIYPSYSEQLADIELPEGFRALVGDVDYATGPGFVSAEFLSWVPIVLVIFAIMSGGSLSAEEKNGTLDLLLAQPIERSHLFLEKVAALAIAALAITGIIYIGWLASVPFVDIDVGLGALAVATLNLLPLVLFLQVFTMWAGLIMPRGVATGAVVAFAVVSYFVDYIAKLVADLEDIRLVSVFYHYRGTEILTEGVNWPGVAVLLGLYAAFVVWALTAFKRRDIGVGAPLSLPFLRHRTAT